MAHDQAVYLLDFPMGKLLNAGVAVRALQVAVRAVQIEILGDIQEPELTFLAVGDVLPFAGDIAEAPVPVAEKAIFFINRR
jgi:hypothetical protein